MKKQTAIAKKSEDTTNIGSLLFSASPKLGCTPLGGDPAGLLDNCSGVSPVKRELMIDRCSEYHTSRSTDTGCEEFEVRHFFSLRNQRLERVNIAERES